MSKFQEYLDKEENITCLSKAVHILRAKISKAAKWKFEKSLSDYDVPKELRTFIKWIVIGKKSQIIGGERKVENTISSKVIGQLVMNSFKTDRQVSYKPLSNEVTCRQRNETSIALGLSLMAHNVSTSRNLVFLVHNVREMPYGL